MAKVSHELAELYCQVNDRKKLRKALRRAFGEKSNGYEN